MVDCDNISEEESPTSPQLKALHLSAQCKQIVFNATPENPASLRTCLSMCTNKYIVESEDSRQLTTIDLFCYMHKQPGKHPADLPCTFDPPSNPNQRNQVPSTRCACSAVQGEEEA